MSNSVKSIALRKQGEFYRFLQITKALAKREQSENYKLLKIARSLTYVKR